MDINIGDTFTVKLEYQNAINYMLDFNITVIKKREYKSVDDVFECKYRAKDTSLFVHENFSKFFLETYCEKTNKASSLYTYKTQAYCMHDWKTEYYFSARAFTTCTRCGAKKEEL